MISAGKMQSFSVNIYRRLCINFQCCFLPKRLKSLSTQPKYQCEHLETRTLIKLTGSETLPFLQGLVTNDIRHLEDNNQTSVTLPCLYAAFLNQQGRILYDSILYRIPNLSDSPAFLLECDSSISDNLIKHLKLYRIRKKIEIADMVNKLTVWSLFPHLDAEEQSLNSLSSSLLQKQFEGKATPVILTEDPRHAGLGYRCILPVDSNINDILPFIKTDGTVVESQYAKLRYKTGIGEGIQDHPPGKCFPLECNMDFLHGVSFHKGCYIGQELTARTHHTGVIRKRLMPVRILNQQNSKILPESKILNEDGTNVGKFRSQEGYFGLALLRVTESLNSKQLIVKGTDIELSTMKPFWWPQQSTKN